MKRFALILVFAVASTSHAIDIQVDDAVQAITDGQCGLIEALINAQDDAATYPDCAAGSGADRLVMTGTYVYRIANALDAAGNGLPEITTPIEIFGNGSTFLGNGSTSTRGGPGPLRLLSIVGAVVRVQDLTFRNGWSNGTMAGGAGAWVRGGADVTFSNVRFTNNEANGIFAFGGGLRIDDSTVRIEDSVMNGNRAQSTSPETGGGAIALFDGTLEVVRSALILNAADQVCDPMNPDPIVSTGGALRVEGIGTLTQARFEDSTLADNIARSGGAVHVVAISDTGETPDVLVELVRSTVVRNQSACGLGDGLYIQETAGNAGVIQYNGSIIHGNGRMVLDQTIGTDCQSNFPSQDFFSLDGNILDPDDNCTTFGSDAMVADLSTVIDLVRDVDHYPLLGSGPAVDNPALFIFCPLGVRDQLGQLRAGGPEQGGDRCDAGAVEFPGFVDSIFSDRFQP